MRRPSARVTARPRTLRSRLLLSTVALLVAVGVVFGVVTSLALGHALRGQVDHQLGETIQRSVRFADGSGGEFDGGFDSGRPPPSTTADRPANDCAAGTLPTFVGPGQPQGTVVARFADGVLDAATSGLLEADQQGSPNCSVPLTSAQGAVLRDQAGAGTATVEVPGLGGYRVRATTLADGTLQVTGLPLADTRRTLATVLGVEAAVVLLGTAVAALLGTVLVRRELAPLERVAATAAEVSGLRLDTGEVDLAHRVQDRDADGETEVGRVGRALNGLLDNVEAALGARHASEQRVRQFVADASHELRTPLAAIRGYAELTRRSREPVPADVAHAVGRVESEAVRMTGLVEDLLLLARLDSGRPLEREPVDLTVTVLDAVSDARVAGPEHRWRLDLPADAVEVTGDAARLHQVLANLLANARTHTPPGTTVVVAVVPDGARTHLDVVDDGPGIPAALLPDVFERFARGDSSRSRAAGSTGLGLAIVQAVVTAHGGDVGVTSRPGRTAFRVTLPSA